MTKIVSTIPILTPFPQIATHVINAELVRSLGAYIMSAPVFNIIGIPDINIIPCHFVYIITPGILISFALISTTCGIFPLGQYYYRPDNWEDESFRNGLRQEYKVNVAGGSDKLTYYFGLGYLNDEGVIVGAGFERISTRTNVEYQAKEWLKLSANISYTNSKSNYPGDQTETNSSANAFGVANQLGPVYPFYVRNADGSLSSVVNDLYIAFLHFFHHFLLESYPVKHLQSNTEVLLKNLK